MLPAALQTKRLKKMMPFPQPAPDKARGSMPFPAPHHQQQHQQQQHFHQQHQPAFRPPTLHQGPDMQNFLQDAFPLQPNPPMDTMFMGARTSAATARYVSSPPRCLAPARRWAGVPRLSARIYAQCTGTRNVAPSTIESIESTATWNTTNALPS